MHRQIEIMFAIKGDFTVVLGENRHLLHTGDYVIIKPFELHTFGSGVKWGNKFVSPIFPDEVSNRLENSITESVIGHADAGEWGEILSLYKTFSDMSPANRMLYFEMLESMVRRAINVDYPTVHDELTYKVISYIRENASMPLSLESVASACCTNRCTVSKIINNTCHQNFNNFLNRIRISAFLQICIEGSVQNIEAAASEAGFGSPRTFYRAFFEEFAMTPGQYIEKLRESGNNAAF